MKRSTQTSLLVAGTAALAAIAFQRNQSKRGNIINLSGKVVLITGGSHGLGIALARGFAKKGCRLALCARNESELDRARLDLAPLTADVLTVRCDVSDRSQVELLIQRTIEYYGRIDVLVNNAGVIHLGPIHAMTLRDFETAMDVMFWGTVYTTLAALPHMESRGEGRIINITSVGAKVSVPHLLPYSCAKFACAAFSEGMRAELNGTGVKVVTIAPGLMRTGSHRNAIFRGAEAGEAAWFSLGASLPLVSMSAEKAAGKIIAAAETGSAERILGVAATLLSRFHGLFPNTTAEILGSVNQLLPHGIEQSERGADSPVLKKAWMRALTMLGSRAAKELLQPD